MFGPLFLEKNSYLVNSVILEKRYQRLNQPVIGRG